MLHDAAHPHLNFVGVPFSPFIGFYCFLNGEKYFPFGTVVVMMITIKYNNMCNACMVDWSSGQDNFGS